MCFSLTFLHTSHSQKPRAAQQRDRAVSRPLPAAAVPPAGNNPSRGRRRQAAPERAGVKKKGDSCKNTQENRNGFHPWREKHRREKKTHYVAIGKFAEMTPRASQAPGF